MPLQAPEKAGMVVGVLGSVARLSERHSTRRHRARRSTAWSRFKPGEVIGHSLHYAGYGCDRNSSMVGNGAKGLDLDVYHTFSFEWSERGYTHYIDGVEDRTL